MTDAIIPPDVASVDVRRCAACDVVLFYFDRAGDWRRGTDLVELAEWTIVGASYHCIEDGARVQAARDLARRRRT